MRIIILRHLLYLLLYLCPCLDLDLFLWYICDLFSFSSSFSLWVIVSSDECRHTCSSAYFLEYVPLCLDDNVDEKCEKFWNNKSSAAGCCLAFAWFLANFSLALLIKVLLIKKKSVYLKDMCITLKEIGKILFMSLLRIMLICKFLNFKAAFPKKS